MEKQQNGAKIGDRWTLFFKSGDPGMFRDWKDSAGKNEEIDDAREDRAGGEGMFPCF